MQQSRIDFIKRASYIAIAGNAVLAVLKIVFGLISGSLAVVGDGIDTTTDIITSIITLLAAVFMARPPDREHPYGHHRIEVLATKLVSFVIFFVGAQLALSTLRALVHADHPELPTSIGMYVTIVSIAGKIFLAYMLFRLGRTHESLMTIANAKNMLNDIFISSGVLAGLVLTQLLKIAIIDTVIALCVSIWVMKTAVEVFLDSSIEVMEGVRDHTIYDQIFEAVASVEGASNPHRTRIRQISNLYVVDMDVEVDAEISVEAGHNIAMEVEETIKTRVRNIYDIIVHVEPRGNDETGEKYGRSVAEG